MQGPFTRPEVQEDVKELTVIEIYKLIDQGHKVFCGKCGKELEIDMGVRNCNDCFPLETLTENHDLNLTIIEDRIIATVVVSEDPKCERGDIEHAMYNRLLRDLL